MALLRVPITLALGSSTILNAGGNNNKKNNNKTYSTDSSEVNCMWIRSTGDTHNGVEIYVWPKCVLYYVCGTRSFLLLAFSAVLMSLKRFKEDKLLAKSIIFKG